ncbi:MAG: hypothetical protein KGJ35_00060 [Patescibacteria group bacterium]|nr:hypothetical protein [Patescibacteria group bacterium]
MKKSSIVLVVICITATIVLVALNPGRKNTQQPQPQVAATNVQIPDTQPSVQKPAVVSQTNSNEVKVRISGLSFAPGR